MKLECFSCLRTFLFIDVFFVLNLLSINDCLHIPTLWHHQDVESNNLKNEHTYEIKSCYNWKLPAIISPTIRNPHGTG